jgi:hypothetical protein
VVLLWSVFDPVFPKLVLSAPEDVCRFKFNTTIPSFVVGGCFNGQIALWDISLHHNLIDHNDAKNGDTRGSDESMVDSTIRRMIQETTIIKLLQLKV